MAASPAAMLPHNAATEPPPGAGESEASSSTQPWTVSPTRRPGPGLTRSSMIFSRGSKRATSERPRERTAVRISSFIETPANACCWAR